MQTTNDISINHLLVSVIDDSESLIVNMDSLKQTLHCNNYTLNDIQLLHEYLVFLRESDKFIFDCSSSYLIIVDSILYAFAHGKDTNSYRLDYIDLSNETLNWDTLDTDTISLFRIRNALNFGYRNNILKYTNEELISKFLSTLSPDIIIDMPITYNVPHNINHIEESAFQDCKSLKSIIIPTSVTTIDSNAFKGCVNLVIKCRAELKPKDWSNNWNPDKCPVIWGYEGD